MNKIDYLYNTKFFFLIFPIVYISGPLFTEIFLIFLTLVSLNSIEQIKKKILKDNRFVQIFFIIIFFQGFLNFPDINYKNLLYIRFYFYYLSVKILVTDNNNFNETSATFIRTILYSFLILISFNLFQLITSFGLVYERITIPIRQEEISISIYSKFYPIILVLLFFSPEYYKKSQFFLNNRYLIYLITVLVPVIAIFSGERMNTIMLLGFIMSILIKYRPFNFLFITFILVISFYFILFFDLLNLFERIDYIFSRYYTFYDTLNDNFFEKSIWGNHYIAAFEIFKQNYIFGTGIKTFHKECLEYVEQYRHACSSHPHNIYLEISSEIGVFGLICITAIFFKILKILIIYFFKKKLDINQILIFSLSACIMIYVFPFRSTGSFFNNYNSCFFWVFFGLIYNFYENKNYKISR